MSTTDHYAAAERLLEKYSETETGIRDISKGMLEGGVPPAEVEHWVTMAMSGVEFILREAQVHATLATVQRPVKVRDAK